VTSQAPYDLVFANILATPLKRLAPQIANITRPGSHIVLSGILHRQARGVQNVYNGWRMVAVDKQRIGEWTTLTLRRC